MWSSEEYDKKINEFMRRAGQLKEETPDETETEEQKQIEEEVEKIEEMIARETPLKPCPFCGGKAQIMHMGYPHWIYCEDCGAKVHGRKAGEVEGVRASAKIWNSRIDFLPPRALKGRNLTNEDCVDILSEIWNKLVKIPPISMEYCDAISRAQSALIRETKTNDDLQDKAIDVLRSTGWIQEHDKALTERHHGEWIPCNSTRTGQITNIDYKCSECAHHKDRPVPYCEICGADMRKMVLDQDIDGAGKDGNVKEGETDIQKAWRIGFEKR
jgi:predicted nucleic acid-binding Zn ribbon protein